MKILLPMTIIAAVWAICGSENIQRTAETEKQSSNAASVKKEPDRADVQRELVRLANQISDAAKDGDVTFLAKISTDDFQLTDIDGTVKSKNKTLAEVKEERAIRSFEIYDDRLVSFDGDTAVLSYTLKVTAKNGRSAKAATTDTYVRENGKWLIKSEQQTLLR